jgi:hypothetical protein
MQPRVAILFKHGYMNDEGFLGTFTSASKGRLEP